MQGTLHIETVAPGNGVAVARGLDPQRMTQALIAASRNLMSSRAS
jgi:hypothetical protein